MSCVKLTIVTCAMVAVLLGTSCKGSLDWIAPELARDEMDVLLQPFFDAWISTGHRELARDEMDVLLQPGTRFRDCGPPDCPLMVVVPECAFRLGQVPVGGGSISDQTRQIAIPYRLAVGVYEVTFEEWDACVEAHGCGTMPRDWALGRGRRPVSGVRWSDAVQYLKWLGTRTGKQYRLLSEAEWECSARAGSVSRYWWGDSIEAEHANYYASGTEYERRTRPVGSYLANSFGLHDLSGSVWEWVQDCWTEGEVRHGWVRERADCVARVVRGGSWRSPEVALTSTHRASESPDSWADDIGFRVARRLEP